MGAFEGTADDGEEVVAEGLREVVAAIVARHDPRIAVQVVVGLDHLAEQSGDEAAGGIAGELSFAVLAGWLAGAREAGLPRAQAKAATAWAEDVSARTPALRPPRCQGRSGRPARETRPWQTSQMNWVTICCRQ
ncbi:hypothetical protein [Streptomyces sp. NPDC055709]